VAARRGAAVDGVAVTGVMACGLTVSEVQLLNNKDIQTR